MRGSSAIRAITSEDDGAAELAQDRHRLLVGDEAMPGTIRASATVSQPFSSAKVSASASAATAPTAKIALASRMPSRSSRCQSWSAASANRAASVSAMIANGIERP